MNNLLTFWIKPKSVHYHVKPYWSQMSKEKLVIIICLYFERCYVVNCGGLFSINLYSLNYCIKMWSFFITEYGHPLNSVLRWVYTLLNPILTPRTPPLKTITFDYQLPFESLLFFHTYCPGPVHLFIISFLH